MDIISIFYTEECQLIIKLILIFILSGIIGRERAALSKPAGLRTHVLVGISAVLVVECGIYIVETNNTGDPTRIAAQLLSGIGFLGAGTILRDGFSVKGLTTAASLLSVTCIGLVVGAGFYLCAIVATIMVYFVLTYSKFIAERLEAGHNEISFEIEINNPKEKIFKIQEILNQYEIKIIELKILENDDDRQYIKIVGEYEDKVNKNKLISDIMAIETVKYVAEI